MQLVNDYLETRPHLNLLQGEQTDNSIPTKLNTFRSTECTGNHKSTLTRRKTHAFLALRALQ